jgi:deazaflavin-dependent oxidoreductase (nitroreductase family)
MLQQINNWIRDRADGFFGSPFGATFIRATIQPLDHLCYRLSGRRYLFLNAFIPTLMLTSIGAKSGQSRTVPLLYLRDGARIVLIASNYGQGSHPAWYRNLQANPSCTLTIAGREQAYLAREADGAERDRLWQRALELYSGYAAYQTRAADRRIPVLILEPVC